MLNSRLVPGDRRLAELQLWAISSGASQWIVDVEPYERCVVAGLVERVRIAPVEGTIEASITDGTERLTARWSIRRPTPELAVVPGRAVVLHGIARQADTGLVMVQPAFEIVPSPAAA